jgi:hypothetical protein
MLSSIFICEKTGEISLGLMVEEETRIITFTGYLFETSNPSLGKEIRAVIPSFTVGFRAIHAMNKDGNKHNEYGQILLIMEGSTETSKCELIIACKKEKLYEVSNFLNQFVDGH